MFTKIKLTNILFLDIETVPEFATFDELSEEKRKLFEQKTAYKRGEDCSVKDQYDQAGIWAEFGKIICISVGYFAHLTKKRMFRLKSFYGDERKILLDFKFLLDGFFNKQVHVLCAHNGKEFDFPYIARRMIIHTISLPDKLNLFGKKPWEVPHLDTLELWKFGDYKQYTSLKLLTHILGIPSPKQDIDGSQVADVYYKEQALERIVQYCERDTVAVAQLVLRYNQLPLLQNNEIYKV
ncbi:3'-5' exonuclease [Flavobacteriaceae bacterium F08102]|nr:3'-5' exonuclease [Flavobacteriaceae bacterium F08102]